ncbi:Vps53-like protein [Terfezia claveryi]|nr:Vps53-like protein [Terfezia claveryi]
MPAKQDPLDSAQYDPIDHLNALFSHPATLSSVPATAQALHDHIVDLDEQIAALVATQMMTNESSLQRVETAKADLAELFKRIDSVRERAIRTEMTITEMTADIKKLDGTKRNLTISMTALKRLQMLTTAYEQLKVLCKTRQYRECAQLLQAVIQLMAHFRSYRSIDQIALLSRNVSELQRELLEQVCEDFEITFAKGEVATRNGMLAEACVVMDSLQDNGKQRIISWYCNTQLREYRQVFRGNDEAGSLDNISRRYAWLKRILKTYDEEHATIFPTHWKVGEVLSKSFCDGTRDDFKTILSKAARKIDGKSLDVNLLLSCLQETLDFEQWLERRFADVRVSIDTMNSRDEKPLIFGKAISEAFEPYLSLWIDAQDKQLSSMIPKYRARPLRPADEEFSPSAVHAPSTELFNFYRLTLAQCAKLSTGSKLLDLSQTFAKYLDQYAENVLMRFLLGEKVSPITSTTSSQSSLEDLSVIINTADYCHSTTSQLSEKIRTRIESDFQSKVDFEKQQDSFLGVANAAIKILVKKVEVEAEPSWREMRNISWSKLENVGDQSSYVSELVDKVKGKCGEILGVLSKDQYIRAFCDKVVDGLVSNLLNNVVLCKPISDVGAEQMLLDSYVLKKAFEELLTLKSESGTAPPAGYLKHVNRTFAKVDSILKTIQVQSNPPEGLVQAYLIHVADKSDANFRKVLELKGIKKSEQPALVELFRVFVRSREEAGDFDVEDTKLVEQSAVLSPLLVQGPNAPPTGSSLGSGMGSLSSGNLQSQISKFDARDFGNALINAAREGVDRLQTPGTMGIAGLTSADSGSLGGGSNTGLTGLGIGGLGDSMSDKGDIEGSSNNGQMSTTATNKLGLNFGNSDNLNENLRNLGRFFRRETGGRFGATGGS